MVKQRFLKRSTLSALTVALALAALAEPALALQGGEDPSLLPVLVDKRFGAGGRHQLGLQFSTALASKFVEGTGGSLTYGYNFGNLIGLELNGAFFATDEASIMAQVRCPLNGNEPQLSDLHQFQWTAGGAITMVPVYGKMSFASEFDPAWDLLLLAGGGVAGVKRQTGLTNSQLNQCPGLPSATYESKTVPLFNFGLALRFYITKLIGLRVELRDYFFPDPGPDGGLSFNLHFQAGLQFTFGG